MKQPIVENIWWVIPGKLAGMRKPTADEMVEIKAAGIGAIVVWMITAIKGARGKLFCSIKMRSHERTESRWAIWREIN